MLSVKLLTSETACSDMINNAALAGLTCTANTHLLKRDNFDPFQFLRRRINEGHESVIEHINLTFEIRGISRALLQELARHRHVSLSVESTRWTLGKVNTKNMAPVMDTRTMILPKSKKNNDEYWMAIGDTNEKLFSYMQAIANLIEIGVEPDIVKYFLPELYPTNLVMTCNLRELRHIWQLRSKPPALKEFQDLCGAIRETLTPPLDILLCMTPGSKQEHKQREGAHDV